MADVVRLSDIEGRGNPGFAETSAARSIATVLRLCQASRKMGVITGGPGVGKSAALERFAQADAMNVKVVTITKATAGYVPFLTALAEATEGYSAGNGAKANWSLILRWLQGKPNPILLVLDEAQRLSDEVLEELPDMHKTTGCGVVLCGNVDLLTRIETAGENAPAWRAHAATGLMTFRLAVETPHPEDIESVCRAIGVPKGQAQTLLAKQAKRPGALRNLINTADVARLFADGGPLTADHVQQAIAVMGGQ